MMKTVAFGEVMLRLGAPGFERLFQSPTLTAGFGGAEANVAVSLAQFGLDSYFVSRVPAHAVGDAAIAMLRTHGVRTDFVQRGGARLGIYFSETGASQRASSVIYDRAHSAISQIDPDALDWGSVLDGARWFHWSGITPALSSRTATALRRGLEAARAANVPVSVDLNYRRKLWTEDDARATMLPLMSFVDLVIANEEDLQTVLGVEVAATDVNAGILNVDAYAEVARKVVADLNVAQVAITLRESLSASDNGWSALFLDAAGQVHHSQRYEIRLVDRVGAGDSFAAGLIYGLLTGRAPQDALRFAVAASALKHTIPGDVNQVTVAEVERLAAGDARGRIQR
jgi:2-dehydro-3-deoxygluconokinase